MSKILELEQMAEAMDIAIDSHIGGEKGRWYPIRKTVSIRKGLHPIQHLCTLAHELGHAHHGHVPGATGWVHARQEREANEWAAGFLISQGDYQRAEEVCEGHVGGIASELGVTQEIVRAWRGMMD